MNCGAKQKHVLRSHSQLRYPYWSHPVAPLSPNRAHSLHPSMMLPNDQFSSPAWWKLPVVSMTLGIFGLSIVYFIVIGIISDVIFGSWRISSTNEMHGIVLSLLYDILWLGVIVAVVHYFKGFAHFWEDRSSHAEVLTEKRKESTAMYWKMILACLFFSLSLFLLLTVLTTVFSMISDVLGLPQPTRSSTMSSPEASLSFILSFLIRSVIMAPIVEEWVFRGYLQQSLERGAFPEWFQYGIQAVLFTFIHFPGDFIEFGTIDHLLVRIMTTIPFAIIATWLKKEFKSMKAPILFHALANGSLLGSYLVDVVLIQVLGSEPLVDAAFLISLGIFTAMLGMMLVKTRILRFSRISLNFRGDFHPRLIGYFFFLVGLMVMTSIPFFAVMFLQVEQVAFVSIGIGILSPVLFFFVALKTVDVPIDEIFPELVKNRENSIN